MRGKFLVEVGEDYVKITDQTIVFEITARYQGKVALEDIDITRHFEFFVQERNKVLLKVLDTQFRTD